MPGAASAGDRRPGRCQAGSSRSGRSAGVRSTGLAGDAEDRDRRARAGGEVPAGGRAALLDRLGVAIEVVDVRAASAAGAQGGPAGAGRPGDGRRCAVIGSLPGEIGAAGRGRWRPRPRTSRCAVGRQDRRLGRRGPARGQGADPDEHAAAQGRGLRRELAGRGDSQVIRHVPGHDHVRWAVRGSGAAPGICGPRNIDLWPPARQLQTGNRLAPGRGERPGVEPVDRVYGTGVPRPGVTAERIGQPATRRTCLRRG